jgi:hypothetical protein
MNPRDAEYIHRLFRIRNRNSQEALKVENLELRVRKSTGGVVNDEIKRLWKEQDRFNQLTQLADRMIERLGCGEGYNNGPTRCSEPRFRELVRREKNEKSLVQASTII